MPLLYPDLRPLPDVLLQGQGRDPGGYEGDYPQSMQWRISSQLGGAPVL